MVKKALFTGRLLLIIALMSASLVSHTDAPAQDLEFGPPYLLADALHNPFGLAIDQARDHLIVVDTGNHRLGWINLADVLGTPVWTYFGRTADSSLPEALVDPQSAAVDSAGNVYVVDTRQNEVQRFTWDAGTSNYVYVPGFASDTAHVVDGIPIDSPRDIAVGPDDSVYLLDSGNNRVLVAGGPDDLTWEVFLSDPNWGNPYGIGIGHDGKLYIADTDNHRILRHYGGLTDVFGAYGTGPAQFRYPRDVAVDIDGRMYVVDCFNHRMEIIDNSGAHVYSRGHAPLFAAVQKIVRDDEDRVFIVDSDRNAVIAFLGEDVPVPFDLFLRDYVGDSGSQPSDPAFTLASPDILLRHDMDIDVTAAETTGLDAYAFEQARYGENNYIYIAVHNKGTQLAAGGFLRLYWTDQASGLVFPDDFRSTGFHQNHTPADEINTYIIPPLAPSGGVHVLGPILWHPPHPEDASTGAGDFRLVARVVHPFDTPEVGSGTDAVRRNNNVALRNVKVIAPPFPTGEQNTLVISVHYSDIPDTVDRGAVETRIAEMNAWIEEASYGEVVVDPLFRGPIPLGHDLAHYSDPTRNLLIEMAQDVLDRLLIDDSEILNGVLPSTDDDIDRLILVTNDSAEVDWATTGYWPYNVNGEDRYLTVSVQGMNNSADLFAHGYCHQLGMIDLYPHEFVTLPFPYADGWDNMAQPINGVHPLVWSKQLATWVTEHDANILFIPRPERGETYSSGSSPLELYHQSTAARHENIGIAIGLSPGVTALEAETHFFYLEARDNTLGNADSAVPGSGVLMYYVNEETPSGRGPVMIRDHGSSPDHDLTLAAIPPEAGEAPEGTGINVTVHRGPTGGADYLIDLSYEPPITDYDVYINRGDPPHISPDIWIQKQPYTYDETSVPTDPEDRLDEAEGGQENRIWAMVHNRGEADAYNVDVLFHISEPYQTVGGIPDFEFFNNKIIPVIPAGESRPVSVPWTPTVEDPHSCVRVVLQNLFDDINDANNDAQQNIDTYWSTHESPYKTISYPFQIKNGEAVPQLIYFRSDGVPRGWEKRFIPEKVYLMPDETAFAAIEVTPPESAPECTSYDTQITAWTPRGDTLVKMGGTSLIVNLGKKVELDVQTKVIPCEGDILDKTIKECCAEQQEYCKKHPNECKERGYDCDPSVCPCMVIDVQGCTDPPLADQEIEIRYRDEEGNPIYHFVVTDEHGCFHDYMVVTEGGEWNVNVHVGGEDCIAPTDGGDSVSVPLPDDDDPSEPDDDPSYNNPAWLHSFNRNFMGSLQLRDQHDEQCATKKGFSCKVQKIRYRLALALEEKDPCNHTFWQGQSAVLESDTIQAVFYETEKERGYYSGPAVLKTKNNTIIQGVTKGMINTNAHRLSGETEKEPCALFAQFDGRFEGVVVEGEGPQLGTRVIFDYTFHSLDKNLMKKTKVKGRLKGVTQGRCQNGAHAMSLSDDHKLIADSQCLMPVSKQGEGSMARKRDQKIKCPLSGKEVYTSEHRLHATLKTEPACDKDLQEFLSGSLVIDNLVHNFEDSFNSRGRHGGDFVIRSARGITAKGKVSGFTHLNSHKGTSASCLSQGHMQGMMTGYITNGPYKGAAFRARYTALIKESDALEKLPFSFILEGMVLSSCSRFKPSLFTTVHPPVQEEGSCVSCPKNKEKLRAEQQKALKLLHTQVIKKKFGMVQELSSQERKYADKNNDAKISEKEFIDLRVVQESFKAMDKDNNGALSLEEIYTSQIEKLIEYYFKTSGQTSDLPSDRKDDRTLSHAEAVKVFPPAQEADSNNDKCISRKELRTWLKRKQAEQFRENDRDQNGTLDFKEYLDSVPVFQIRQK